MRLTNHLISEIRIGQSAELRRLVTIDDLWSFASISGNVNPMNLPGQDNDADGQPDNGAPGMFLGALISAVPGTMLPGAGSLYQRQVLNFHPHRVRAGDEILCRVTVTTTDPAGFVDPSTEVRRIADDEPMVSGEARVRAPRQKFDRDDIEVPGLIVQRHRPEGGSGRDRDRPLRGRGGSGSASGRAAAMEAILPADEAQGFGQGVRPTAPRTAAPRLPPRDRHGRAAGRC